MAATADLLCGSWELVDYRTVIEGGDGKEEESVIFPLGRDAQGMITYTADGIISAHLMRPGAPPHLDTGALHGGTDEERARSLQHSLAYAGFYSVSPREEDPGHLIVRHRVVISSFPNWLGTVQARLATIRPATRTHLVLETEKPVHVEGTWRRLILTWRRIPEPEMRQNGVSRASRL
ncbi:hypothetical protein ASPZODRAFT_16538 [Penicilliopsis zonata CBS 506.65]|uniref:Lipocalin-like domain-containing protein n=1 Tax=Penicilliopsis zonata CBS 506.65 TaxID=1073090 RepID=A0A1L9SHY3_9EURO|nr:hypothetical protein ASPZODRAFT_16538 [Penicilliopsis zonata CBS 506.65]OJJ46788.1 hypothetical protein ASPZODRAFT_16538 [Penicilliopsis zonata CBS 506.65]